MLPYLRHWMLPPSISILLGLPSIGYSTLLGALKCKLLSKCCQKRDKDRKKEPLKQ